MGIFSNVARDFKEGVQGVKEGAQKAAQKTKGLFASLVDPETDNIVTRTVDRTYQGIKNLEGKAPAPTQEQLSRAKKWQDESVVAKEQFKQTRAYKAGKTVAKAGEVVGDVVGGMFPVLPAAKESIDTKSLEPLKKFWVSSNENSRETLAGASPNATPEQRKKLDEFIFNSLPNEAFVGSIKKVGKETVEEAGKALNKAGLAAKLFGKVDEVKGATVVVEAVEQAPGVFASVVKDPDVLKPFNVTEYLDELKIKQDVARSPKSKGIVNNLKNLYREAKSSFVDSAAPIEDRLAAAKKKGNFEVLPDSDISLQIDRTLRAPTLAGQFMKDGGLEKVIRGVDDLEAFNQYLIARQAKDVASRGVETGRNLAKDEQLLQALAPKYEQMAQEVTNYSKKLLDYTVDRGLISRELADELNMRYKNYVPIQRIFNELEEASAFSGHGGGPANLTKQTLIKKLEGSGREIEDPLVSLLNKTNDAFSQGERNRAAQILTSYQSLPDNPFNLQPLRTAEQVKKRRAAVQELGNLRSELDRIKNSLKITNAVDQKLVQKINRLYGEMDELSEEAIQAFVSKEPTEAKQLIEELKVKVDDRAKIKKTEEAAQASRENEIVHNTQQKERLKVLDQDISQHENAVKKAKTNADLEAAQKKLETSLQEKALVLGEKNIPEPKPNIPSSKISVTSKNVGPSVKQSIEQQIAKRSKDIEDLKNRIATREIKLKATDQMVAKTEATLDTLYQNFNQKKGQIKQVLDELKNLQDVKSGTLDSKNIISVFRDGIQEKWLVDREIAEAAKNLDPVNVGVIGEIMNVPSRIFKAGTTGLNLVFGLKNVPRDQLTAFINSQHGLKTSLANPRVFGRAVMAALKHNDLYDDLIRAGGGGTSFDITRNQIPKTVEQIRSFRSGKARAKYLITNGRTLFRAIEDALSRSEELTRLQQFEGTRQALLRQGRTLKDATLEAARAARENTANFVRGGRYKRVLNAVGPYLNASIQGSRAFLRGLERNPKGTIAKTAISVLFPSAMVTAWNLSDPKRREAYEDIAETEKENYLLILPEVPEKDDEGRWNAIKIPAPPGIADLAKPIRAMFEQAYNIDEVKFTDFAEALLGPVDPFNINFERPSSMLSNITPQAIRPSLEAYTNMNFFTGLPQVPKSLERVAPEMQVRPGTSGLARKIGGTLNASPIKVEEFIRGTFGGLGLQGVNIIDQALSKADIIPEDQIGGQSIPKAVVDSFMSARGGQENRKEVEELYQILEKQSTDRLKLKLEAEALHGELSQKEPEEANKILAELKKTKPELAKKVKEVASKSKLGITAEERLLIELGVENQERAKFIHAKAMSLPTKEARNEYINSLRKKKIVSDEVLKQLRKLAKEASVS